MVKVTSTEQALKGVLSKGQTAPKKAKGKSFYPADGTSRPWKNFLGIARSRRWTGGRTPRPDAPRRRTLRSPISTRVRASPRLARAAHDISGSSSRPAFRPAC